MTNPNAFSGKTLRRSRDQRMLSGVAGGLGEYFDIDPTLVRLGLVAVTVFTGGAGLIAYAVAWVVMPESDGSSVLHRGQQPAPVQQPQHRDGEDIASRIYDDPPKPGA